MLFQYLWLPTGANGKQKIERKVGLDTTEFLMNFLGPTITVISLASFMHVFLEMDSIQLFIPTSYLNQPVVILLRIAVQYMAELDWCANLSLMHLVFITVILHTKSIFRELALLKARKVSWNVNEELSGSKKAQKSMGFVEMNDLQLYSLANYCFNVANKSLDFTFAFILAPGCGMFVTANYMILMMYEEFPFYLYVLVCLLEAVSFTEMAYELPRAGKTYEASCELLHGWKVNCPSRKSLRYKRVMSFRPVGFTAGGFFTFKLGTVTTVAEQVMDFTISAILSF
jgi:hypothetical protein